MVETKFKNWRLYPHVSSPFRGWGHPSSTLWSYAPTLVESFGYGRLKSNPMVSVDQCIQLEATI